VTRDKLVGCLWPDADEETARHLLSNALYLLRREMGEESVRTTGDTVHLNPEIVWSDVVAFQEALAEGNLEEAAAGYTGPFLDGFYADTGPAFAHWIDSERRRLALGYAEALESLADRAEAANDQAKAAGWWQRVIAHDPYNSRAVVRLMQALAAAGDRANALQVAAEHGRLLKDDLELQPSAEVLDLARKLREKEAAPAERKPRVKAPSPPEEVGGRRPLLTRRRAALAIVAALALAALVATGRMLLREPASLIGGAGIPVSPNRIAVMPFEYRGSDETAYLSEGMAYILPRTIDGAGQLTAVDAFALLKYVEREYGDLDPEGAAEVARYFGAGRFILGSIIEAGGSFRVGATLYDVGGGRIGNAEATVDEEAEVVDELTHDLAMQLLRESLADMPERLTGAGAQTTDSLEAMKAYLQGEAMVRAGKYDSAAVAYRRAVDLDTTFALAYYRLACNTPGQESWHDDSIIESARRFSGRLSWRDSLLVEALHATWVRNAYAEAEATYNQLLTRHPDELDAWVNLTMLLGETQVFCRGRPYADLRDAAERAVALDPTSHFPNLDLSLIAAFEGNSAQAIASLKRIHEAQPEGIPATLYRAVLASLRDDPDELEKAIEVLREGPPTPLYLAGLWIWTVSDDAPTARRIFESLTEPRWSRAWQGLGHRFLMRLELARGRWAAAQDEITAASTLDPVPATDNFAAASLAPFMPVAHTQLALVRDSLARWRPEPESIYRLFFLGLLNARLGQAEQAQATAAELEGSLPTISDSFPGLSVTVFSNLALTVRAQVAASEGRYEEALTLLEQVEPVEEWRHYARPERWLRAEVLYSLGRYEEALPWYEPFVIAVWSWDQAYATPALLRIGDIHERLGNLETAARHYRRFLKRWEGCDPELQTWVDQAQRALERLTGED
jgi:DNA-binding SARP family transcriptional activator